MLTISLGLFFFVGVLTAVKQNNSIQTNDLSKTIIEKRSRRSFNLTAKSPFKNLILITNQSSINTVDQSVITKVKRASSKDCDRKCHCETSECAEDGSRCICRDPYYIDVTPERSSEKTFKKISSSLCPPKWKRMENTIVSNKCLRVFTGTGISELYASQFCGRYIPNAELAILDSSELAIFAGILALQQGSFKTFRFGLSFDENKNRWVWSSGKNLNYESSDSARDLKKIDPMSGNRCATILTTKDGSHWAATSCNNSFLDGFICQIDPTHETSARTIFLFSTIAYVCAVAPAFFLFFFVCGIRGAIEDCIDKYKNRRPHLTSSSFNGQEYVSPIPTVRMAEYQDPSDRTRIDRNSIRETEQTLDISHDITIITPSASTRRHLSQSTDQEDQNPTTFALTSFFMVPFAICIHECIYKYKTTRPDLTSSSFNGQEYVSPIPIVRTAEYQDPSDRTCNAQEDQNPTTATAINLHLTNQVQCAIDRESADLPSYQLACQMPSPSQSKSIKMEVEFEMDSDELPSYEDAVNP